MTELVVDSRLINLNSKDAVKNNGAKLSDVYFKFRNLFREDEDVYYITCGVLNAQIPVSFYNINVNNQTLVYTVSGTSYTMTVPQTTVVNASGRKTPSTLYPTLIPRWPHAGPTLFRISTVRFSGICYARFSYKFQL